MGANGKTSREAWLAAGLETLAAGGPDAVRVERLAQQLSVTKGSFYWHFGDRLAFLDELLDTWERMSLDDVIERVEQEGGDARARLRRLLVVAAAGDELLQIDLAVRDWARRDEAVAARLRRVDGQRMEYMRSLLTELLDDESVIEARCMLAFSLWIGRHFVAADHGERSRADVVELAFRELAKPD